ncbi:amidohydrolase [Microbacterium sp. MPKO10]|uniref:amidohydrolase n=1 Tax=Microbacterium sp. MPKO10 TaxID=2989818 RepID=UPI0022360451|nr:amidohydrolase [Microbacterium sp. MPKO10]MCW4457160.1 amidohydrolase [Microbacterium sp. MPKO10]
MSSDALDAATPVAARLLPVYEDLHRYPELSFHEVRTAGIIAARLAELGYDVHEGVGRTGVVGVLRVGEGPVVMLRADMDALPVREQTGLPYASSERGIDPDGNDVPVMHACGHDIHVTALLGAAELLAGAQSDWSGTLVLVFQPAEENGGGAQVMIDDGLYDIVPAPDVVMGQHVMPLPTGFIGVSTGPAFAATDELEVRLFGRGGHGSQPESTIDPVVMAAATVMRLQTIVSREVAGRETAVLTIGTMQAGSKSNVIADEARLGLNIRSYDPGVRDRVIAAAHRIVNAEAAASGVDRAPEITGRDSFPVLVNDPAATGRTVAAFAERLSGVTVREVQPVMGSEDIGNLAIPVDAPIVYWLLGGADPALFPEPETLTALPNGVPSNHSPFFAPVPEPTLRVGIAALTTAAREWLRAAEQPEGER